MMNETIGENSQGIYIANRESQFREFICNLLKKQQIAEKYISTITDDEGMLEYGKAFTSKTIDAENNYEVYEQLGDAVGKKFIIKYFYQRFPLLKCPDGVKIVARLNINYGAKQSFFEIAKNLGFWQFISATNELRRKQMKSLCEDVFEAFLGVTEFLLDTRIMDGVGYPIVSTLLKSIFDDMPISLRYEDLYDAKTRLKELFDMYEDRLGPLQYVDDRKDELFISRVYRVDGGKYEIKHNGTVNKNRIIGGRMILIGEGIASLKSDAQQKASETALLTLNSQGHRKRSPPFYSLIEGNNGGEKEKITVESVIEQYGGKERLNVFAPDQINELRFLKHSSSLEKTTLLAHYCHQRNLDGVKLCLEHSADPNVPDSNGMKPLDLLFMGTVSESVVRDIMKLLFKHGDNKEIVDKVHDAYYVKYNLDYFKRMEESLVIVQIEEEEEEEEKKD